MESEHPQAAPRIADDVKAHDGSGSGGICPHLAIFRRHLRDRGTDNTENFPFRPADGGYTENWACKRDR